MDGTRLGDGDFLRYELKAGEYGRVLCDGEWVWVACTPNGMIGDFSAHEVIEHDDGTITVAPSIEVSGGAHAEAAASEIQIEDGEGYWHGFLENGAWRRC
jgi:hypothetical protein